jgi:prevent-host-death family protein
VQTHKITLTDLVQNGYFSLNDHIWRNAMLRSLSLADAKATLSECVREAETGEPIIITRHGRPVAALVRVEEVERLRRLRAAGPESGLASLAGGWVGSDDLVDELISNSRTLPRSIPELE